MSELSFKELDLTYSVGEKNPVFTEESRTYLDTIKLNNKLPFNKGDLYYSDNIWDFSTFAKINVDKCNLRFNFENVDISFQDDLKKFAIIKMLEHRVKIQTIRRKIENVKAALKDAQDDGYYSIQDIPPSYWNEYFLGLNHNIRTKKIKCNDFMDFLICYSDNINKMDIKEFGKALDIIDSGHYSAYCKNNKLEDIPQEFFDALINITIKIIESDNAEDKPFKGIACMMLILSQTGLRIGELTALPANKLFSTTISDGREADYLIYQTWKREKGDNVLADVRIFINDLSKKAYLTLTDLYKEKREKFKTNILFLENNKGDDQYPVEPNDFRKMMMKYYFHISNQMPLMFEVDKFPTLKTTTPDSYFGKGHHISENVTICYPQSSQFRVRVCTDLYDKGVPLEYIAKYMSHLSYAMKGYYVRTKSQTQEDMPFALNVFRKIIDGEELLGGKKGLIDKINEFIIEGNYNVAIDKEEICKQLAKRIPVRQKAGGICIKSSLFRECSTDAITNEFYCAYNVCPNIYHFYYMVGETYNKARSLIANVEINKDNGFYRQAQKECNMLQTIVKDNLLPELNALKRMMEQKGVDPIVSEYPSLQLIINSYDQIVQEATEWKNLKL